MTKQHETFSEIAAEYAPYNTMAAFELGADAYRNGRAADCPFSADSVAAQAWDRGACAAMRFTRQ